MDNAKVFKTCSSCGFIWDSLQEFLDDDAVDYAGYQVSFLELETGFFLFNHTCGTTLAVGVDAFHSLYDGPVFLERVVGTDKCPGYCLERMSLEPCPVKCECAFVREIIQVLKPHS